MNTPTHQAIEHRARQIWQDYGCPAGRDEEIWLEAETQLSADHATSQQAHPGSRTLGESQSAVALAESAARMRKDARAPITPHVAAPKPVPAETGKPLWSKPHSS